MAEEVIYNQIENGGDPDPLGLRKKLAIKQIAPDPLGLRAKLVTEKPVEQPQQAFQIQISQPTFKSAPAQITREFTDQKQKDELAPLKLEGKARVAHEAIQNELIGNKDIKADMIKQRRFEQAASNISVAKTDMPKTQAEIDVQRLIPQATKPQDLPITDEDLAKEDIDIQADRGKAIRMMEETMKKYPEKAKEIQKNLYTIDAFNSLELDQHDRVSKIEDNAKQISKGNLIYDARSNKLIKPLGLVGGAIEGWKQKSKLFADYDFLKNTENDAAIAMDLEDRRNRHDMDEPIPVPKGKLSEITQMLGGTPIKPILGGAIASFGGPQAGMAAGAIIGGREFAKLEYASTFQQVYNELRGQGVEKFEAVRQARSQAEQAAEVGAVTGGAMGLVGAKIGVKPIAPMPLSNSFKQAAFNVLKSSGHELGNAGLEGLAIGGVGAAGQVYKNQLAKSIGIDRPLSEGVAEQIEMGLLGTVAMAAAIKAGRGMTKPNYRTLLHGLSKMPDEQVNGMLQEKVQSGEITQKAADETQQRINEYKEKDAQIPPNVTEEARFKIQDNIDKLNELEQQKETTHKSLQEPIKERIEKLTKDNLALSKEIEKPIKPENGLSKDQAKEATEIAEEWLHEGILPDTYEEMIKKDPIGFWKMIAQQAQKRDENWRPLSEALPEDAVRDQFGDTVVDYAKELFPAPEVKEPTISIIQPGEIKHPETITIKPQNDALPEKSSLSLPKTYGESKSNQDIFPERSQTQPKINRETAANLIGENEAARLQASIDWLDAIESNNSEKSTNAEEELIRQSMAKEGQVGELLGNNDRGGEALRTSGNYGKEIGEEAKKARTRPPQESEQLRQRSGQSGTTEPSETFGTSRQIEGLSGNEKSSQLSEFEKRRVVEEVQKLPKLRNNTEKAQSAGIVRHMLEQALREDPSKTKQIIDLVTENLPNHALRERISKEISLGQTSRNSPSMGARIPESEETANAQSQEGASQEGYGASQEGVGAPPLPPSEGKGIYVERPSTQLSFRGLQEVANEFGYEDVKSRDRVSDIQERKNAEITTNEWAQNGEYQRNVDDLLNRIESKEHVPTAKQRLILEQYLANESQKLRETPRTSPEFDRQLQKVKRIKDIGQIARQEAGAALRLPEGGSRPHPVNDLTDAMVAKMEANAVDKLTDQQKADVEAQVDKYKKAADEAAEKTARLEEQVAKLEADKEFKKVKSATKREKKTAAERIAYRRGEIEAAREALRKLRTGESGLSAVPLPGVRELMAIAPHVKNIMVDLVAQGVDNLQDVVSHLHNEFKDVLEGLTEKNIHDIIAGEYNEKGKPLSELQRQIRDLQDEAKLINQLEALENGTPPKTEKAKRERNQKIKELRDKIKGLKAEDGAEELRAIKKRNEQTEKKIKDKIQKGEFEKEPKKSIFDREDVKQRHPELRKEALDAIAKKEDAQHEFDLALFNDEMAKRSKFSKAVDFGGKLVHTSKALMAGIDDSATFVQNGLVMLANPKLGAKVWLKHWKEAFNDAEFKRELAAIHARPDWEIIKKSELDIVEPHTAASKQVEEAFEQNLLAGKIKIKGEEYQPWKYTGGIFERAFTSMGNNFRLGLFEKRMNMLKAEGKTFESHPQEYKDAARAINELTGRGKMPAGLAQAAPYVTPFIWAPRLLTSTINTLGLSDLVLGWKGKGYYQNLTPTQRRFALGQLGRGVAMGVAIMGAASLGGAKVDYDPRSVTFGDIIAGDHHYNVFGRYVPVIKALVQAVGGVRVRQGGEQDLDNPKYGGKTRVGVIGGFFRGKMTPAAGAVYDLAEGKNYFTQEPFGVEDLPAALLTPLSVKELKEGWQNDGTWTLLNRFLPAFEGIKTSDERDFNKSRGGSGGGAGATQAVKAKPTRPAKPTRLHK